MFNQKEITMLTKKLQLKHQLISDTCNFNDVYIVVKGNITVTKKIFTDDNFEVPNNTVANAIATNTATNNVFNEKSSFLKTMLHLSTAFQKLMV